MHTPKNPPTAMNRHNFTDGKPPSDNGDDLICGFGRRRRTEESGDSSEAYDSFAKKSGSGDNTLICGFGGDGGSCSSPDVGEESLQEALQGDTRHWVPEGDLQGREESVGSDSNLGQNVEHHKALSDLVADFIENSSAGNAASIPSPAPERLDANNEISTYSVSTKTDDGSGSRRPARRRSRGDFSRSSSSASFDDMSMASEDAVVLMLDLLNDESEKDGQEGQERKSRSHTEICGRVYRHVPNVNYDHLPTELDIGSDLQHTHGKPRSNEISPLPTSVKVSALAQPNEESPVSHGPPRNISVEHEFKMPASAGSTSKQKSNTEFQPPVNVVSTQEQSHVPVPTIQQSAPEISQQPQDATPTKQPAGEFPRPKKIEVYSDMLEGFVVEEDQLISTKLEMAQRRRSTDLDIIEEGSGDSQSDSVGFKSSFASTKDTSSDYAFSEDDAFDADIDPEIDILEAVVSRKKALTGEHAKSMAKKLKAPVRTLSERMTENIDDEGKEEGRVAILSRQNDAEYVKKVVHKPANVKKLIREAISNNILFKACSDEELEELVDVFDYKEASAGSIIIRQGDDGDAFYVMEQGIVDVAEEGVHKTTLSGVISFGEIALLYGCPRSATLRARQFCKLWYIGRTAFRAITSQHKRKRLEAKIESLKKVKIKGKSLSEVLGESEIDTLALAAISESYKAGHVIIREGDPGDIFYMIESGSVDVFIQKHGNTPVATLTSGQYFGEMALLSNDPRAASCVAKTDVKCHILMRNDFILLLGDLESLMKTNYRKRSSLGDELMEELEQIVKPKLEIDINDLDVIKVLGIGAFGRVQLAKLKKPIEGLRTEDDDYFALKCISKQSLKASGLEGHMHNEKNIMASLDHPFINRFYCEMEDEKHLYFLLEALTGGELCKRLREEKKFPEPWGRFYSASVLFAFCHMHAMKIAYRDLKPENLVMDSVGYVKVVDFGLAKVVEGGKTWTLCGTPAYLAPEIVLNDGHDWGVDYWAFGVFLFEMTSGKEPFRSKNPMEVYKQIVSGHVDIPSYFTSNLADLIRKLLNISKSKRLGRTMGGGGAVMQHRWYNGFDWDAHLEKRLKAPLTPKTDALLRRESTGAASAKSQNDSTSSKTPARAYSKISSSAGSNYRGTKARISYSLGQGNRHHQKLLEMMGGDPKETDRQNDAVRMSMLRVIKQNERWSKSSDYSEGNDSTRNTSLGVGAVARSYIEEESSVSSDGMMADTPSDAALRMQLMNMSLPTTKRDSLPHERVRAFQQFSLLGVNPLSFEESDIYDNGGRCLDPFSTKNITLIDQFPTSYDNSVIDSEALAAFCFSNGLSLRLIPKCAVEGATRLGWLGPDGDHYQLQGFTDFAGSLSHGIAITIFEELVGRDARKIVHFLILHRMRRRARAIIARWLTKRLFHSPNLRHNSSHKRHRRPTDSIGTINQSFRGAMDRLRTRVSTSGRDISSSHSSGLSYESDDLSYEVNEQLHSISVSEHARRLGREAYQVMLDAEADGYTCIVEKSYVITGTPLKDQSLFFCGLQNLINMERMMKDKDGTANHSNRRSLYRDEDDTKQNTEGPSYKFLVQNRHAVLSALQSRLMLDPNQKRVCYPRSEMAHIQTPQRKFVMNLSLQGFDEISLPLPLPMISGEWGLATLFLRIKDSGVMILLKLLLLERSVLVVGSNTEEVTSCATALLEMLNPYKWASAFMPLLPGEMLDFVSSPVPFIAGTIVENSKRLQEIIHDTGVREAMLNGLSIVNLVTGKLIVTRERGTSDMLRRSFQAIPELTLYQRRLEDYSRQPSSNLRTFQSFFKHGASRKETLTLCKIRGVIKKHLSQYTAGLNDRSDAWQQYGEFNEAIGTFDFCPDKFIQPLKDRMIFQIQFQEMMAHTQLFVGYIEDIKGAHEKRSKLLSGPPAKIIVEWIEAQWYKKHNTIDNSREW